MIPIYLCLSSLWDMWCSIHKVSEDLPLDTFLWVHIVRSLLDFHTIWKVIFDLNVLNLVSVEVLQGLFPYGTMPPTAAMLCILSPPAKLSQRMPTRQEILFASSLHEQWICTLSPSVKFVCANHEISRNVRYKREQGYVKKCRLFLPRPLGKPAACPH